VSHELSEYSLADIHPSLSAIAIPVPTLAVFGKRSAWKNSNRKIQNCPYPTEFTQVLGLNENLTGQ
jgi:hypothetical protein